MSALTPARPAADRPRTPVRAAQGAGVIIGALALGTGATVGPPAPSSALRGLSTASYGECVPHWRIIPGPSTGTSYFAAVAALSPRAVWAVGSVGEGSSGQALAARWNGTRWQVLSESAPPQAQSSGFVIYGEGAALTALAALSANDVWAAGSRPTTTGARAFIVHWTGRRWHLVSSSDAGPDSALRAMAAVSAHDVWAAGDVQGRHTLVEHWDGRVWRIVPTPRLSGLDVRLSGMVALAATNIWAVGAMGSASDGSRRGLVEHWNGTRWQIVPSPQPGVVDDALARVGASSATNVWAVGSAEGNDYQNMPFVERWTGTAWRVMPRPSLPAAPNGLAAVAVLGPRDVWAAAGEALTHWTGMRWQITKLHTSRFSGGNDYALASIPDFTALAATPAAGLWAAGRVRLDTDQQYVPLIARYSAGACR